jgi:hypothetical protein
MMQQDVEDANRLKEEIEKIDLLLYLMRQNPRNLGTSGATYEFLLEKRQEMNEEHVVKMNEIEQFLSTPRMYAMMQMFEPVSNRQNAAYQY